MSKDDIVKALQDLGARATAKDIRSKIHSYGGNFHSQTLRKMALNGEIKRECVRHVYPTKRGDRIVRNAALYSL